MPVPYSRRASKAISAGNADSTVATSAIAKTEGMRLGARGRCTPSSHGRSMPSTEKQCAQRLVVRGSRYPPLVGQHGQKTFDLLLPHVSRMPLTVPFHKRAHPLHIGLFVRRL